MGLNHHQKNSSKAYLYAGLSVLLWSTAASAFKISLGKIDFIQILFIATLTSCLVLFIILVLQGKMNLLLKTTGKEYLSSAMLGILNPFLYYLVLLKAYSLLPAQVAQPLNFTWPLMLVLLAVPLLNQKISLFSIFAMAISFIGVYLISSRGNPFEIQITDSFGVFLALGSSVIWALFWIYNIRDKRDDIVKLFLAFLFALLPASATILFSGGFNSLNWYGVAGAVYIGIFEMGITFVFWLKALQYAESTDKVSALIYITPFLSLLLISQVVGEKIYLTTIGGLVLIVTGIILQKIKG